jgi:alpha-glucosidase
LTAVRIFQFRSSPRFAALAVLLLCGASSAVAQAPPATTEPANSAIVSLPGLYDPVADPKAIVTVGNARFTVLTPQLIRMEWAGDGKFEGHASLVFLNRKLPVPKFETMDESMGRLRRITIETDALALLYMPNESPGGKFDEKSLQIKFKRFGNERTSWHPGMPDTGNLQGTTRTLDGALGGKTQEPMDPGLISRDGWVVVDDSTRPLFDGNDFRFDQGDKSTWPWVKQRPAGDCQDLYFFGYGHDYAAALHDFTLVAGKIPLPPRFAFGAWWSRYWAYSDQELMQLARDFRSNDVPLDVFVIDMDWHPVFNSQVWWNPEMDASGHPKGWSGYSWNKTLFPDPEQFLHDLHALGLKATLNLHPASGIQPWEDAYPAMARAMGVDPTTGQYIPFDITDKKFAFNYLDQVHRPLERQGIDFWWLDWQQENNTKTAGVNPTWWLNYVHFSDQARQGKRPLLFHRWGGLGNHRYQIGFSGDTISVWESLAFQPWFTATAANVGYAYWSHDIGGHMPGVVEPELYTRWIQFGIYSPILRTHTTKNPNAERRIWAYPEPYSDVMRNLYHQRYAMLPYIYTEARGTYDSGVAFLHPLYYDWPEANEAYDMKNEYVFGSQMIVNPIVQPGDKITGLAKQQVWIPKGEWIEKDTGAHLTGPAKVQRNFSIEQMPAYVREGAIVPMAPPMEFSNQKPVDPLIVTIYPLNDGRNSKYSLYEDAGDTRGYQTGQFARTEISATAKGSELTVTIAATKGSYPGMLKARAYELRLPGDWPPDSVVVNGKRFSYVPQARQIGWRYEGNTLTTIVTAPPAPVDQQVSVQLTRSPILIPRRAELHGFAGAMARLHSAVETIQHAWPFSVVPEELIDAAQAGDRLGYYPAKAGEIVAHYHQVLPKAQAKVAALAKAGISDEQKQVLAKALGDTWSTPEARAGVADYPNKTAKALAAVNDAVGNGNN